MTCDDFYLTGSTDRVRINAKDCSMKIGMEIYYDDFTDALNTCVNEGIFSDWLIDKVQELLKSSYQLGDLPITASEFEKTNAILEELRI